MATHRAESPFARSWLLRIAVAFTIILAMLAASIATAEATPQRNLRSYAGIVVDAKTGKVLYESHADSTRYPASIAKVMTLYVLFQELAAGNIKLSTKMKVSRHAAAAVPTKLGLKAGSTIAVEDAIKSLVTISANDMARVIAETISGSESKFAERMTRTARALGMSHTRYTNASGLPDGDQVTTVRDQAILAVAIYQHFPKYYKFFQTRSFKYGRRTYRSHVPLFGVDGVEGLKTGYINNSGYNLMTVSRKDGHHLVVIGFGFNTPSARNKKVASLLDKYLPKSRSGNYLQAALIPRPGMQGNSNIRVAVAKPVFVAPMPMPSFRLASLNQPAPMPAPEVQVASLEQAPIPQPMPADLGLQPAVQAANKLAAPSAVHPAERPVDVIGAWISETFSLGAPPAPLGQTAPSEPLVPPVGVGRGGQPIDLMTSGAIGGKKPANDNAPRWVVQIGAMPDETGANKLLDDASSKIADLADYRPYVERFDTNGRTFYRARYVGFGDRDAATRMCDAIKEADMSCLALQS